MFQKEVLSFLGESVEIDYDGALKFTYQDEGNFNTKEIYYSDHHLIPQSLGIWTFPKEIPFSLKELYIFPSAIEALSFLQCRFSLISSDRSYAFVSLGLIPKALQISRLKELFPSARLNLVLGRDLPGRVADCRIALWWKERDGYFSYHQNFLWIQVGEARYTIPEARFSLHSFEKIASQRFGHRTIKPPDKCQSFYQLLITNY